MPGASGTNEHVRLSGATYSPCGRYRYRLWRGWNDGPSLLWIMLNPSTADHLGNNDPTIARCERRTRAWGYGRIEVVNLFALKATDPRALRTARDPVGAGNDRAVSKAAAAADAILCAWGSHGALGGRAASILRLLDGRSLLCLSVTRSGEPAHPLYLPYRLTPVLFPPAGQGVVHRHAISSG